MSDYPLIDAARAEEELPWNLDKEIGVALAREAALAEAEWVRQLRNWNGSPAADALGEALSAAYYKAASRYVRTDFGHLKMAIEHSEAAFMASEEYARLNRRLELEHAIASVKNAKARVKRLQQEIEEED